MDIFNHFVLYPTTLIVRGHTRSLLCDTERNQYYPIPHILEIILTDNNIKSIQNAIDVYSEGTKENEVMILDYFEFLLKNELLFFTKNGQLYQAPIYDYDYPGYISNGIVDIGDGRLENVITFILQCEIIFCRVLQVRFFCNIDINSLIELAKNLEGSIIEWVELILPFNHLISLELLENLIESNDRLRLVILYGYVKDEIIWQSEIGGGRLAGVKTTITSHKYCGIVNEAYFSSNLIPISESKKYNSCLNRKISIDIDGNIKNCPSMNESYGNIKETSLIEAINNPAFTKYQNITKDKIYVCKDCEFRYICTDCRAYVEDPLDIFSKPLKCGYNPYTGEWSEWSTNPLKQKAIKYYGMEELVEERTERLSAKESDSA